MKRPRTYTPDPVTFADRLVAGVISAMLMFIVVGVLPFVVDIGTFAEMVDLDFWGSGYLLWVTSLTASTLVTGFMAGPRRMATFWGHFFGTEEPARPNVTGAIWLGIVAILGLSLWIA